MNNNVNNNFRQLEEALEQSRMLRITEMWCCSTYYFSPTKFNSKHMNAATALSEMDALTTYIIVFYAQLIIGGFGAFLLIRKKKKDYVAPWIAFIVVSIFSGW